MLLQLRFSNIATHRCRVFSIMLSEIKPLLYVYWHVPLLLLVLILIRSFSFSCSGLIWATWCYGTRITPHTINLKKQYCIRHFYSDALPAIHSHSTSWNKFLCMNCKFISYRTPIKIQQRVLWASALHWICICILSLTFWFHLYFFWKLKILKVCSNLMSFCEFISLCVIQRSSFSFAYLQYETQCYCLARATVDGIFTLCSQHTYSNTFGISQPILPQMSINYTFLHFVDHFVSVIKLKHSGVDFTVFHNIYL